MVRTDSNLDNTRKRGLEEGLLSIYYEGMLIIKIFTFLRNGFIFID